MHATAALCRKAFSTSMDTAFAPQTHAYASPRCSQKDTWSSGLLIMYLCSLQGTLPVAAIMQYSSNIDAASLPPMPAPAVKSKSIRMHDVSQVCHWSWRQASLIVTHDICLQTNTEPRQSQVSHILIAASTGSSSVGWITLRLCRLYVHYQNIEHLQQSAVLEHVRCDACMQRRLATQEHLSKMLLQYNHLSTQPHQQLCHSCPQPAASVLNRHACRQANIHVLSAQTLMRPKPHV